MSKRLEDAIAEVQAAVRQDVHLHRAECPWRQRAEPAISAACRGMSSGIRLRTAAELCEWSVIAMRCIRGQRRAHHVFNGIAAIAPVACVCRSPRMSARDRPGRSFASASSISSPFLEARARSREGRALRRSVLAVRRDDAPSFQAAQAEPSDRRPRLQLRDVIGLPVRNRRLAPPSGSARYTVTIVPSTTTRCGNDAAVARRGQVLMNRATRDGCRRSRAARSIDEIEAAPGGAHHPHVADAGNGREAAIAPATATARPRESGSSLQRPGSGGVVWELFVSVGRLAVASDDPALQRGGDSPGE